MRLRMVRTLFRKEMLDTLRDRRTLLIMILLPILIYPLFGIVVSQAQFMQQRKLKGTRFSVGIIGALPPTVAKQLMVYDKIKTIPEDGPWKRQLREGELAVVLRFHGRITRAPGPEDAHGQSQRLPHWPQQKVVAYVSSTRDSSRAVWRRVQRVLRKFQRRALQQRLRGQKLSYTFIKPVLLVKRDVVDQGGRIRYFLSMMFPTLLVILTVMGAFYPAIDLTAGEKERGTLETLLTAPVSALEIVTGKYLAVTCIAAFTGALNLLSLWFTFAHGIRMAGRTANFSLGLHAGHYAAILFFLVLVAALSSALMIAIASLARSFKEGQNYVTPGYMICLIPAIIPAMPGAKATLLSACVPIVNVAYAIQLTIKGGLTASFLVLSLVSMVVSVALALVVAARIFAYEQVLFREGEFAFLGKKGRLSWAEKPWRPVPSVEEAFVLLGGLFVLFYYVGMPLQQAQPAVGLGIFLWFIVLGIPLVFLRSRKIELRRTLRLRRCHPLSLVGAVVLAVGAAMLSSAITEWLSPILFSNWKEFVAQASRTFHVSHFGVGPWAFFFLLAISPGICEELLFRGAIMSALRTRLHIWPAILLTALLFGAFHLHLYRLLPTTLVGIVLGWICIYTGSIWPAIVAHATNNALALGLGMLFSSFQRLPGVAPLDVPWMGVEALTWQGGLLMRMAESTSARNLLWGVGFFGLGVGLLMVARQRRQVPHEPAFVDG